MKLTLKKRHQERYALKYRGTNCLNCAHPLDISDKYCPNCSQANTTKKLTLSDFFDEFFASIISYDSRLLRTLSSLLFYPGKITKEYIAGKKISYTNPFRFLLSVSIIYFILLSYQSDFSEVFNLEEAQIAAATPKSNTSKVSNAIDLNDSKGIQNEISRRTKATISRDFKEANDGILIKRVLEKTEVFYEFLAQETLTTFTVVKNKLTIPSTLENQFTFRLALNLHKLKNEPQQFYKVILGKLPFFIFFYLPVFTLFVWIIYIRKPYSYTDHLVFSFHNQTLLFLLLIISLLFKSVFNFNINGLSFLLFCGYLFMAMRNFYQQGKLKTFVKYMFLNGIFMILISFSLVLLLVGSIITY